MSTIMLSDIVSKYALLSTLDCQKWVKIIALLILLSDDCLSILLGDISLKCNAVSNKIYLYGRIKCASTGIFTVPCNLVKQVNDIPVDTLSPLPAAWYRFCYWEKWLLLVVFSIGIHPAGIILCMHPANERWCYNVMSSLIGWAHPQIDPWSNKDIQWKYAPALLQRMITKQAVLHFSAFKVEWPL